MLQRTRACLGVAVALAATSFAAPSLGQSVADFYKGRTIAILVEKIAAASPDLVARMRKAIGQDE